MGERKVLNKYFPPDFDPKLVPKRKWDPFKQIETRMMLPFNVQCDSCGEFMYRGKKFNMRKEDVHGDDYKGIRKYRFYFKCILCSREITFITDPENIDYAMEHGAKRLFEVWKEQEKIDKDAVDKRAEEERADAMKALEHRTIDSKLEMDIMDALEETKAMSGKRDAIKPDQLWAMREEEDQQAVADVEADDERLVKKAFAKQNGVKGGLKKLEDSDEEEENGQRSAGANSTADPLVAATAAAIAAKARTPGIGAIKPVIKVTAKKRKDERQGRLGKEKVGKREGGSGVEGAEEGLGEGTRENGIESEKEKRQGQGKREAMGREHDAEGTMGEVRPNGTAVGGGPINGGTAVVREKVITSVRPAPPAAAVGNGLGSLLGYGSSGEESS